MLVISDQWLVVSLHNKHSRLISDIGSIRVVMFEETNH